ncbi:MAG TPA: arylesterase [Gemmatimonadales bacterium]|nr:arylesterase [Gemmatimonadales bacterium]
MPAGEAAAPVSPVPAAAPERPTVLVLGTSLTAGLGVDPAAAWPAVLQRTIDSAGLALRVVNAGVSGETSAGALRRVDWMLEREHPAVFILETGGNDGLRGLDPDTLLANILEIFARTQRLDPPPVLVLMAMESPPNLGARYTRAFRAVYPAAAESAGAVLVPFFLEGVAGIDSLNQPDGIHPTPQGHALAAANAWRVLEGVLRTATAPSPSP